MADSGAKRAATLSRSSIRNKFGSEDDEKAGL